MITYRQFLIHPNLRAYLDHNGKLTPMFVYTEFETLDQVHARIDRYWQEWQEFLAKRKTDVAKSFQIIKASIDLHDESQQLESDKWNEKIEQYYDNQLNEDK